MLKTTSCSEGEGDEEEGKEGKEEEEEEGGEEEEDRLSRRDLHGSAAALRF